MLLRGIPIAHPASCSFRVLLVLLVAVVSHSRTSGASNSTTISFEPPPGWSALQKGDTRYVQPHDSSHGEITVAVLPGDKVRSNFTEWFQNATNGALIKDQIQYEGKIIPVSDNSLHVALMKQVIQQSVKPVQRNIVFIGFHPGERGELLAVMYEGPRTLEFHRCAITQFLLSLQFASARPPRPSNTSGSQLMTVSKWVN
jgi:hypothetical protein